MKVRTNTLSIVRIYIGYNEENGSLLAILHLMYDTFTCLSWLSELKDKIPEKTSRVLIM